jgi:hypothetical protein
VQPAENDLQLAKRLRRSAETAGKLQARAEQAQARAWQRRLRRIDKARRRLPGQLVVAVGAGLATIPSDAEVLLGSVSAIAGLAAIRSMGFVFSPTPPPPSAPGRQLMGPPAAPSVPPVPMPPPAHSAAFPAVRRLELVRAELYRLLPLVAPVGREAGEQAWHAAAEADTALRWQAARLAAVEPHRGADPELLRHLEDGVACQEQLVVAVADLVAASADPLARGRLQDATDALHGLAQGLRELR